MKKIAHKTLGALLLILSILIALTAIQLNWSMINTKVVNLTIIIHVLQLISVACIIYFNKNQLVDYAACLTLLFSGIKPANSLVNQFLGKIEGIAGAAVPVVLLLALVALVITLIIMTRRTNHPAAGKALTIVTSVISVIASILVGFIINALAENQGVNQINLVAEGILAAVATIIMIISFFLTQEDKAKVVIVVALLMTWWPIINNHLITRIIGWIVSIDSYKLKGLIPVALGMLSIESGRFGIKHLLSAPCNNADEDGDEGP